MEKCPYYRGVRFTNVRLIEVFLWETHLRSAGTCGSVRLREVSVLWDVRLKRFHCTQILELGNGNWENKVTGTLQCHCINTLISETKVPKLCTCIIAPSFSPKQYRRFYTNSNFLSLSWHIHLTLDFSDDQTHRKTRSLSHLRELRQSYVDGFTTHGLTKTCSGQLWERIFWFICVSVTFSCTIYACHMSFLHYKRNDIRTEIRIIEEYKIPMPAITFCLNLFQRYHCYQNKSVIKGMNDSFCNADTTPPLKVLCMEHDCKPVSLHPDCITINLDGSMHSIYRSKRVHVELTDETIHPDSITVYLTSPEEERSRKDVLVFNPKHMALINGNYEFLLDMQKTSRLPAPYTTNCSNGESNENFFTKHYSRYSCLESCWVRYMVNSCGAVIDRWKPLLPNSLLEQQKNKSNIVDTRKCLYNVLGFIGVPDWCKCPVPCHEVDFGATLIRQSEIARKEKGWRFQFKYKSHKIKYVTAVPEYPFKTFLSSVGGLVGLLFGNSTLSVVEVVVFCILTIIMAVIKIKK